MRVDDPNPAHHGYRDDDRLMMIQDGSCELTVLQDPRRPERFGGRREGSLYELIKDPHESKNLLSRGDDSDPVKQLRRQIAEWDRSSRRAGNR